MSPLTEDELLGIFRRHFPEGTGGMCLVPRHRSDFVDSKLYAFAREVEHRSFTAGMMAPDHATRALVRPDASRARTGLWGLVCWMLGAS